MEVGDIILYHENGSQVDYSVVTTIKDHRYWAYWVKEKQTLTFNPTRSYYTKVGPSILGRWQCD